jgi:hypothetical protein
MCPGLGYTPYQRLTFGLWDPNLSYLLILHGLGVVGLPLKPNVSNYTMASVQGKIHNHGFTPCKIGSSFNLASWQDKCYQKKQEVAYSSTTMILTPIPYGSAKQMICAEPSFPAEGWGR